MVLGGMCSLTGPYALTMKRRRWSVSLLRGSVLLAGGITKAHDYGC